MREGEKISLLLVDDDANLRYLMETAAQRIERFEPIATAVDGQAALDWLRQQEPRDRPDLIVTDLSMPRLSGLELVRALKADASLRAIPVAVITSSDVPNDREDALAAGAYAFMQKPHGLDALTTALRTLRDSCCDAHVTGSNAA